MRKPQLPESLLWDHNAHYHPWLVRQIPANAERALDVGCGVGTLARHLARRVAQVDAVDLSPAMIERARARTPALPHVRWLVGDVLDSVLPLHPDGYDAVTALSSLHHMSLRPALTRLAELVRPGGTLAVVGMYRQSTAADRAVEVAALPANAAVGAFRALRGRGGKPGNEGMPVQAPTTTLADLRAVAGEVLPGARLRRGLFWRYQLVWRRPV
ncbi:class I SAM-dependent methyltransferase [Streptoalloteichus hindustanus]|uniref:Methyltransferase domain-containing protein n=1 Tax=Streptoalloteichus hindustanus TaxID=2017 RepID=A0A1M5ES92_STRHI|nr:class I SAM-dependent methyltransferase [Streptoalloteichus hindustanus]SHF81990.1 Methyltransferase domain-containing protein [Streptoalloteichus hindustanus]